MPTNRHNSCGSLPVNFVRHLSRVLLLPAAELDRRLFKKPPPVLLPLFFPLILSPSLMIGMDKSRNGSNDDDLNKSQYYNVNSIVTKTVSLGR